MKLIKAGNPNWSKIFECKKCHAKLEVDKFDLFKIKLDRYYDYYDTFFTCSECSARNIIHYDGPCEEDIPIILSKIIEPEQTIFKSICGWFK